ncbi:MAG: hypothetical protein AB4426_31530 [Xenococcaceae cyanobacterium]
MIIGRYRQRGANVYVVLTAAHVVQYSDDKYKVVTPRPLDSGVHGRKEAPRKDYHYGEGYSEITECRFSYC